MLHTLLYRVKTLITMLLLYNNLIMLLHINDKYQTNYSLFLKCNFGHCHNTL